MDAMFVVIGFVILLGLVLGMLVPSVDDGIDWTENNDEEEGVREEKRIEKERFEKFMEKHPDLKDKTTINRLKNFIKQQYAIHVIIKELYRLYLLDCDAKGKPPLSYRKWKFAYGL